MVSGLASVHGTDYESTIDTAQKLIKVNCLSFDMYIILDNALAII